MHQRIMDRFVKSVNNMNSTVLVPFKLRDMDIVSLKRPDNRSSIPSCLVNADLYNFYNMLNEVKQELLWDPSSLSTIHKIMSCSDPHRDGKLTSINCVSARAGKHSRQPSDDSLGSLSSTLSSDPETDSETDSLLTDRESSSNEHTVHLAAAFRQHLQALHTILHQFADAADYLSTRYQEEIDSSS